MSSVYERRCFKGVHIMNQKNKVAISHAPIIRFWDYTFYLILTLLHNHLADFKNFFGIWKAMPCRYPCRSLRPSCFARTSFRAGLGVKYCQEPRPARHPSKVPLSEAKFLWSTALESPQNNARYSNVPELLVLKSYAAAQPRYSDTQADAAEFLRFKKPRPHFFDQLFNTSGTTTEHPPNIPLNTERFICRISQLTIACQQWRWLYRFHDVLRGAIQLENQSILLAHRGRIYASNNCSRANFLLVTNISLFNEWRLSSRIKFVN